jgi:hypothetical protein
VPLSPLWSSTELESDRQVQQRLVQKTTTKCRGLVRSIILILEEGSSQPSLRVQFKNVAAGARYAPIKW